MVKEEMEKLIEKQSFSFEKIKTICGNFKKDSVSRKSLEYLENRLGALETHWLEFQTNHDQLGKSEDKEIPYFIEKVYERTKDMYEEITGVMTKMKNDLMMKSSTPSGSGTQAIWGAEERPLNQPTAQLPTTESAQIETPAAGKMSILLRQQRFGFNAFERTVSKINLQTLKEKWEMDDSLNVLKTKWDAIEKNHWELEYILQGSNQEYLDEYNRWEDVYEHYKRKINGKIWESAHYQKSTPRIDLPEFNGNYTKWVSFKDLFIETIHSNPLISKTQKMQYLKTKLKGEAEKLIQHLSVSAEHYESCWDIILHRYENKRLLFSSYANSLLNQPQIQQATAANIKALHDTTIECLNALNNIGIETGSWDPLIVHILLQKLDEKTYGEYIHDLKNPRELPDLEEFVQFLEAKFMAIETVDSQKSARKEGPASVSQKSFKSYNEPRSMNENKPRKWPKAYHTMIKNCPLCKNDHSLMNCPTFLDMTVATRNAEVAKLNVCRNCLFEHVVGQTCNSKKRCKVCNKWHHTFLHDANYRSQRAANQSPSTARYANHVQKKNHEVLLTTVQVLVKNVEGEYLTLRALLDQGSQVTLITENAAQRLRLPRKKLSAVVSGVGASLGNSKGLLKLNCKALHANYMFETEALILNRLINNLPSANLKEANWGHLEGLQLADPEFHISGPIDLLLGADIYSEIIMGGVLKQNSESPVAQQTKLGWILCGNTKTYNCLVTLNELGSITNFWETEEITGDCETTTTDERCEKHYLETTERLSDGRYVVKMPLKINISSVLGKTKPQAISQFLQLERKMEKQEKLAIGYKEFMKEYADLAHMKPALRSTSSPLQAFLPHHGVIREESTSTKLRVVFNASMKSDTKYSLNDCMEKGPNLQKDILALIINWRSYKYVLTADIEKMYRQILIHEEQQPLQKIVWRSCPQDPLQEMQLCTVTYGTKAAPYLAMRTLQQLATDEGGAYPQAERALRHECYMDDVITGHDTIEQARRLQIQLYDLLKKGGFTLRKWTSNNPAILMGLPEEHKRQQKTMDFKQDNDTKTLGLRWNTNKDEFCFNIELPQRQEKLTKRMLLSEISKIYDPLGWLAPMVVKVKILLQKLWLNNLAWDDRLSQEIMKEWEAIRSDLASIKGVTIPRWISCVTKNIELHAYCDASEKAIACVVYSRAMDKKSDYVISLIAAKTKLAPLKSKTSVPRLELCGALLLSKLVEKVRNSLTNLEVKVFCWTDSQVVLAWLQGDNNRWEKYITSRTSKIKLIVPSTNWRYVKSEENPADCASRGLTPKQLVAHDIWWQGPKWLKTWDTDVIDSGLTFTTDQDVATTPTCAVTRNADDAAQYDEGVIDKLLRKYSTLDRVTRIICWMLRMKNSAGKRTCHLTREELNHATELIVKDTQQREFGDDISSILKNGSVTTSSKLLKLTPYLDQRGVLRVGGRLELSPLPMETKHPAILPQVCRLTELIIDQAHKQTLHGGARLTLAKTRERYWIMAGNRTVKKAIRRCVKCQRYTTSKSEQIMGNLLSERVTPSRPFSRTGVDFTGHVDVKINKGRGVKTCKGYIAIFICMVTKAVHIELVSDLTTETFIAALKRMCARRGTPEHLYSDNGSNFRGAAKILNKDFTAFKTLMSTEFFNEINRLQIQWHFNAPIWPTAGGLWEAAVKSMKHHLKRVLGEQKLTYEQFTTLLQQIEACMNSRPLCAISEEVDDLDYITPGHFLTGSPIMSLPQKGHGDSQRLDMRSRWKLTEMLHQHFWRRWLNEYVHQLQVRSKWQHRKENIDEGDLVLVKENNLPPGKWAMGRVVQLHPGNDDCVKVVTIKTKGGILKRPITKLAPLPIKSKNEITDQIASQENAEKKAQPDQRLRRRTGRGVLSNFMAILMLMLMTAMTGTQASGSSNFKLTPIESNRPIYFDRIGDMQLIHDEWNLLIYYNLTSYWQSTQNIKEYVNHIDKLCSRTDKQLCGPMANQLNHEIQQLLAYNDLLLSQHVKRSRRGFINGVGSLANTLFGVLDQSFADKYEQDITKLQANEAYQLELIKNQTSIVEAENNLIEKNENFIKEQFCTIATYMRETESNLNKVEGRVANIALMNEINAIALTASLLITSLRKNQEMLTNALTDVYRGHLDMNLFAPSQLKEQLNLISQALPRGLALPTANVQDEAKEMYNLVYVKARITESYLLFELHIPLISDDEYTLYQPIPIYIQKGDRYYTANPTTEYIATNFIKNTYISLDESELQKCATTNKGTLLCHADHPVYSLQVPSAPCEAKLLSQQRTISQCDLTQRSCSDKWIKLHRQNVWLYMCCDTCDIRVICKEQPASTARISNAGLIALGQECVLQRTDATIYSYNTFGSKIFMGTDVQIPQLDSPNDLLTPNLSHFELNIKEMNTTEDHRRLRQRIAAQREHEHGGISTINVHEMAHYSITAMLAAGIIGGAIYWWIRRRCTNKRTTTDLSSRQGYDNQGIELRDIAINKRDTMEPHQEKISRFNFDFE